MEIAEQAELQALLVGVALPAEKQELVEYARANGASAAQIGALRGLPDREYETIDEVGEELVPVQPKREYEGPERPREESGEPPGGEDYTNPRPQSGQVRDLDSVSD